MKIDKQKYQIILSVGELARYAADAHSKPSSPSLNLRGRLGSDAHRNFQNRRKSVAGYAQEVHLDLPLIEADPAAKVWGVRLRGRLDGMIQELDRMVVEEIKTVTLSSAHFDDLNPDAYPRHKRQLELYLFTLSRLYPDRESWGRLIYINLATNKKRAFDFPYDAAEIEALVEEILTFIITDETRRLAEIPLKAEASTKLEFPFPDYRPGQQEMILRAEDSLTKRTCLLVEAPTGIGKTVAILLATLKFALANDKLVMFLTSRNTQQALVYDTAIKIRGKQIYPRILWLQSKEKHCLSGDLNCQAEECEYLQDFGRRLRQNGTLDDLLSAGALTPDALADYGRANQLCPYELQQAICAKFDLIIGDYNYAFDPSVRLNRLFEEGDPARLILIGDEAHNLPDRARSYYSASLSQELIQNAAAILNDAGNHIFDKSMSRIIAHIDYYAGALPSGSKAHPIQLVYDHWLEICSDFEASIIPYWYQITQSGASVDEDPVILLYRQLQDFVRVLELEGGHLAHIVRKDPVPSLGIICLDASPYLRETFAAAHSGICMSATLSPLDASGQLLGLPDKHEQLKLPSPFPSENLYVRIDAGVTTLYRQRPENIQPLAGRIERFYAHCHCNAIAFFPSFELMRQIVEHLDIPDILVQEIQMKDQERVDMLQKFKQSSHTLLCCVMGGIFAEGIDLPGKWAEAALIVGVGLPAICLENDLLRAYFDRKGENGFNFAYLYPGLQRVVQAAGRIIRTPSDRGVVLLLDHRYAESAYHRLLPESWFKSSRESGVDQFWDEEIASFINQR